MSLLASIVQHPHDRDEMTQAEWLRFLSDWQSSGLEDVIEFAAASPTWRDWPVYVFTNTARAAQAVAS